MSSEPDVTTVEMDGSEVSIKILLNNPEIYEVITSIILRYLLKGLIAQFTLQDFIVIACDGLWDTVSPDAAKDSVFKSLKDNKGRTDRNNRMIEQFSLGWHKLLTRTCSLLEYFISQIQSHGQLCPSVMLCYGPLSASVTNSHYLRFKSKESICRLN